MRISRSWRRPGIAIVLVVLAVWLAWVPPAADRERAAPAGTALESGTARTRADVRSPTPSPPPVPTTRAQVMEAIRRLRPDDGDARYLLYRHVHGCIDVLVIGLDEATARLRKAIGPAPDIERRVDAFRALKDPCRPYERDATIVATAQRLLHEAVRIGDPRAAGLWLLLNARELGAAERDRLVGLVLASLDPEALLSLAKVAQVNAVALFEGKPVPGSRLGEYNLAWELAACDLGRECGAQSDFVLDLCAHQGFCGSASLEESYRRLVADGPADWNEVQRFRAGIVAAIGRRDFRSLGPVPGS